MAKTLDIDSISAEQAATVLKVLVNENKAIAKRAEKIIAQLTQAIDPLDIA